MFFRFTRGDRKKVELKNKKEELTMCKENSLNFVDKIVGKDFEEGICSEIHTRFPPEPNGYLHIGSAYAINISYSIAKKYGGKFNLRFDDTNPGKEDIQYVNAIKEEMKWLGFDHGKFERISFQ